MSKDLSLNECRNTSGNPTLDEVSRPERRTLLQLGLGAAMATLFAPGLAGCAGAASSSPAPRIGFRSLPASRADAALVADGYVAQPLAPWGEPVGVAGAMPPWRRDVTHSAADQALQMGMHHDGLQFYALAGSSSHGLLVSNHEYTDEGLLHPDGATPVTPEKVRKSQAAMGISVVEVRLQGDQWNVVRPSRYARRITGYTPHTVGGPAAGHVLMRTAADGTGRLVLGTLSNCASGRTPWGTYLSGEENWAGYFLGGPTPTADQRRWGIRTPYVRWYEHDDRFDARKHPNEFHRFGWVVEVDPADPAAPPVKRTALGRAAHEGAWVAVTRDQRAVVYSGEDARFEYLYKFVSRDRIAPATAGMSAARANRELLDHGTLYVARFDADGSGRWLPLVHGQGPLTPANGFADAGEVVIKTRQAADLLGATRLDRPEWLAIDQAGGEVYCTFSNNTSRGQPGQPAVDAVNPRARNSMGHIVRWKEDGDFDGTTFRWNHLVLCGDPANSRAEAQGNIRGDIFACPDTVSIDERGVLWIASDMGQNDMHQGEFANMGNNAMLACDPRTGEVRRFLSGPTGCELAGAAWTPDGTTMFVNVQHPGEPPNSRSDPAAPNRFSNWPDFQPDGRPRSATLAIRKRDGGVIGS